MNAIGKVTCLDISKNVFVAVGRDVHGKIVLKRTFSRGDVLSTFANIPVTPIVIENDCLYWVKNAIRSSMRSGALRANTELVRIASTAIP